MTPRQSFHAAPLLLAALLLALGFVLPKLQLPRASYRYLFVFDISQSMNVADVHVVAGDDMDVGASPVGRLEAAKYAVGRALETLPCGAEAGLALFTGHRVFVLFTPVEVCAHIGELRQMTAAVDWRMAWEARSEIAKGLFKSIELSAELRRPVRVVFISDGHEAPPVHPEYRQRFRGEPGAVGGLIVGVGGEQPVPIPKLDRDNRLLGYWRADEVMQVDSYSLGRDGGGGEAMVGVEAGDLAQRIRGGREHLSSLHEAYLRELAVETGLNYLRLGGSALAVRLGDSALAFTEPRPSDLRPPLAAAALALLLTPYLWPYLRAPVGAIGALIVRRRRS